MDSLTRVLFIKCPHRSTSPQLRKKFCPEGGRVPQLKLHYCKFQGSDFHSSCPVASMFVMYMSCSKSSSPSKHPESGEADKSKCDPWCAVIHDELWVTLFFLILVIALLWAKVENSTTTEIFSPSDLVWDSGERRVLQVCNEMQGRRGPPVLQQMTQHEEYSPKLQGYDCSAKIEEKCSICFWMEFAKYLVDVWILIYKWFWRAVNFKKENNETKMVLCLKMASLILQVANLLPKSTSQIVKIIGIWSFKKS